MQNLARYSLDSGDNVVPLPITLQLKWLAMRDMSRTIPSCPLQLILVMLYEGALVPILASLVYCAIVKFFLAL